MIKKMEKKVIKDGENEKKIWMIKKMGKIE